MAFKSFRTGFLPILILLVSCVDILNGIEGGSELENAFVSTHLTHHFQDGQKSVFVFDGVFEDDVVNALFTISANGVTKFPWNFNYVDFYEKTPKKQRGDNLQWTSPINPDDVFKKTKVWKSIEIISRVISGGKEFHPYEVEFSMTRRFDRNTVCSDSSSDTDTFSALVFLNKDTAKNDYTETVFYKDDGEILASVYPKLGRLVIWSSSIPVQHKPPGMSYIQAKYSLHMKLTTSLETAKKGQDSFDKVDAFHKQQQSLEFALNDTLPTPSLDLDKHLTRKFFDNQGRVVAVYDNVLDKKDLDTIRTWFLNYNTHFMNQPYDPDPKEDHDNVSWIAVVKVAMFLKSRLWRIVHMIVEHLSGQKDWHPYDVSMNIIRTAHSTRIHADCEEHEYEFTFLMYLTPDWDGDNYGETAFFDEIPSPDGEDGPPGSEKYELIGAVRPRYGRIVAFRGIIPHSARPPSPGVEGARLTFACKVSKNERVAYAKMLQETMEYLDEDHEDSNLAYELTTGQHENPKTSSLTDQQIKEKLQHHTQERERLMTDNIQELMNVLTA